jgi:hypothetical protein
MTCPCTLLQQQLAQALSSELTSFHSSDDDDDYGDDGAPAHPHFLPKRHQNNKDEW